MSEDELTPEEEAREQFRQRLEREVRELRERQIEAAREAFEQTGRRSRVTLILAMISGGLALLAGLVTGVGGDLMRFGTDVRTENRQLLMTIEENRVEIERLTELAKVATSPEPGSTEAQVARLQVQVGELQAEMRKLDQALGNEAAKALSIPLLRKDTEVLQNQVNSMNAAVDRVSSSIWLIVASMVLAVFGILVRDLMLGRQNQKDTESN